MNRCKTFLAVGAMLTAVFVVGTVTPASADPTGTNFIFSASNFQGDTLGEVIPFGVPTLSASGMVIDSHVTPLPNGDDFIDIWFSTEDGGYLAGSLFAESTFLITDINWGPGAPPAVAVGLLYLSWDSNGVFEELDPANSFGLPILPHPITGQDTLPLDVDGKPADVIPFSVGFSMATILGGVLAGDPNTADVLAVNSMHVGYQIHHIPEPASMMLVVTGLAGLCVVRRRRRR